MSRRRGSSSSPEADRDDDDQVAPKDNMSNENEENVDVKNDEENNNMKADVKNADDNSNNDDNNQDNKNSKRKDSIRESIIIGKDDAAFILGTRGSTKRKVSRVCGAQLDLIETTDEESKLEINGTPEQIALAKDYVKFITQQRIGPVQIDIPLANPRTDLTVVDVPEDCVGFVMGRGGNNLRSMEEDWGSLMFFAQVREEGKELCEKLCIFGPLKARRGAELKVMSTVEYKRPGHFVRGETLLECRRVAGDVAGSDWSIDTMLLNVENFKYALGTKGTTRKKLATASGCIIEYVGHLACICGNSIERARARDYLQWLIAQRTGTVSVDITGRTDVSVVQAPSSTIGFITGFHGESLRKVEAESGTFCFTDAGAFNKEDAKEGHDKILIFSDLASSRDKAKRILNNRISEHQAMGRRPEGAPRSSDRGGDIRYDRGGGGKGGYGDRYGGGGGGYEDRYGGGGGGYGDRYGGGYGDRYGDGGGYGDRYGGKGGRYGGGYGDGGGYGGGYGGKGGGYGDRYGDRYGGGGGGGGGGYGDRYGDRSFDRRVQRPDDRRGKDRSRSREKRRLS